MSDQNTQNFGGVGMVNSAPRTLAPGEFVPGARGMATGHGGPAPSGAAQFGDFFDSNGSGRPRVASPMERPEMKEHMKKCRSWFSNFLLQARGTPLADDEQVPRLLILTMARYHLDSRKQHLVLNCMKNLTIPLAVSTEGGITVHWERQPFRAVPWEVREFPIGVAISILDQCRNTVYDDTNWLWDQANNKKINRRLQDNERPRVGPAPFRAPTEAERTSSAREFGISMDTPVAMGSGAGSLYMEFGGHTATATPSPIAPNHTVPMAGSAAINTEPEGQHLTGAPAAAQAPGGLPPMTPGV